MIAIRNLSLRYGPQIIFDEISVDLGSRDRVALAGSNGSGKSTMLRVLAGLHEADGGKIEQAKFVTLGYLPQDGLECAGKSLYDEVATAFSDVLETRSRLQEAEEKLQELETTDPAYYDLLEVIGDLEHRLEDLDESRIPARIASVLHGLGFDGRDMEKPTEKFSGGWQMRIALAKLLLREPSLLLLDEPTNHLDIEAQQWLETWLARYHGAVLLVSHDRSFLDALCNRTFLLSRGTLTDYAGNYSYYEKEHAARKEQLVKAAANQQKAMAKQQEFIDRFRASANKATMVQSRIKAMNKIEVIELEEEESSIGFRFPPPPPSGATVLKLENVAQRYGDLTVFKGLDLTLKRGDRIALVGPNGAGKSTLVRLLAGSEEPTEGTRTPGHNVAVAYFAQHQALALDGSLDVLTTAGEGLSAEARVRLRTLLGAFLFRGDAVFKKVSVLSGGERNRLALARMLLRPFNCLILDEPTNHLDLRSKAVLREALAHYPGTMAIVSHDRDFLDSLVTQVLEVKPGGKLRFFPGNISDYIAATDVERKAAWAAEELARSKSGKTAVLTPQEKKKREDERLARVAVLRKTVATSEKKLADFEAQKAVWEERMADADFYTRGHDTKGDIEAYNKVQKHLDEALNEWSAASEELDKLLKQG